jgi:hypothetical protein
LIGLSPPPTGHPPGFQPWWVRPSTESYLRFSLPMGRSLGFGSRARDWIARLGLAFATASPEGLTSPRTANSPAHSSKGTPSPAPGCPGSELRQLVGSRFQVLFHSPPGVLFTFPSRYWSTIGRQGVLSLRGWAPQIRTGFHVPRATRDTHSQTDRFSPTGLLPSAAALSKDLRLTIGFVTARWGHRPIKWVPRPPHGNAGGLSRRAGLGSSPFARRY